VVSSSAEETYGIFSRAGNLKIWGGGVGGGFGFFVGGGGGGLLFLCWFLGGCVVVWVLLCCGCAVTSGGWVVGGGFVACFCGWGVGLLGGWGGCWGGGFLVVVWGFFCLVGGVGVLGVLCVGLLLGLQLCNTGNKE